MSGECEKCSEHCLECKCGEPKYYWQGRYFNTFQEMRDFIERWPDEQLDLEQYRKFLEQRWQEAKTNLDMRGSLTNREAYELLRISTDWVKE